MTRIETALDALNIFAKELEHVTRRKKRIDREHIIAAARIGTAIIGALAAFVPQLKIVAGVLNGLNASLPTLLPAPQGNDGTHEKERSVITT